MRAYGRAPDTGFEITDLVGKSAMIDSEDTYSVIALSPGKILWRMGVFASVTVSNVESMLGSNSYPLPPSCQPNPTTFSTMMIQ